MERPLQFLSLFTVGTALAEAVSRPLAAIGLVKHIMTLRELSIIFSASWFLLRWVNRIKNRFALDKRVDNAQVDATSRIATVAIVVVSLLISLDTIGVNIQTVLAFGGIGGVAIGFAGREIISNFFGGFMIYVTQPFSVGEWIRSIEERELNGTVEDIGWYLTRVRTWDKRPLYIPNSRFSTLIVENGSRMDNRRILHTLHLRHEDMPVVLNIVTQIENLLMSHPDLDPRQHRLAYLLHQVRLFVRLSTRAAGLARQVPRNHPCAWLATRNTRDVRPGIDTDQYGPLGRNATFGSIVNGVSIPEEQLSKVIPENYDVPGALQYGQRSPGVNIDTIESGIDPKRYNQHVSPPASTPSRDFAQTGNQSRSDRDSNASKSLSKAAMEASAAAFLFAQRGAMRRKDDNGSGAEGGQNQTEGDGSSTAGLDVPREPVTAPGSASGQMKISRAPPKNEMVDSSVQSAEGATDGKALQNVPAGQMKISRAPPKGDGVDSSLRETGSFEGSPEQRPTQSQPLGQMRITRAPPRVDPSDSNPSAMDELGTQQADVPAGQMKISRAPLRNENADGNSSPLDSTNSPSQGPRQGRISRTAAPLETSESAAVSGDSVADEKPFAATPSGQMKISRALPRREVNDGVASTGPELLGDAFNRQTAGSGMVKASSSQSSGFEEKPGISHNTARKSVKESPTIQSTQATAKAGTTNQDQIDSNGSSSQVSKSVTEAKEDDHKNVVSVETSSVGKRVTQKQEVKNSVEGVEESRFQNFEPLHVSDSSSKHRAESETPTTKGSTSQHVTSDGHTRLKNTTPITDEGQGPHK
ncbi:Mechanosensitive ion channel [Gracilaria domingensis]|nr:Mechanosensitive ion channel [Gracilaria domingensis]